MTQNLAGSRIPTCAFFLALCLVFAPWSVTAQEQDRSVALRIPDGWTELPGWMEKGLPFDASAYYGINERRNREVPYLKAFLEINFLDSAMVFRKNLDQFVQLMFLQTGIFQ